MTKDEVLKMLSKSGLLFVGYNLKASDLRLFEFSNLVNDHIEQMVNLRLEQAVEAEREACAQLCDEVPDDDVYFGSQYASAIRARGNK